MWGAVDVIENFKFLNTEGKMLHLKLGIKGYTLQYFTRKSFIWGVI